jgi:hypothetical protein
LPEKADSERAILRTLVLVANIRFIIPELCPCEGTTQNVNKPLGVSVIAVRACVVIDHG